MASFEGSSWKDTIRSSGSSSIRSNTFDVTRNSYRLLSQGNDMTTNASYHTAPLSSGGESYSSAPQDAEYISSLYRTSQKNDVSTNASYHTASSSSGVESYRSAQQSVEEIEASYRSTRYEPPNTSYHTAPSSDSRSWAIVPVTKYTEEATPYSGTLDIVPVTEYARHSLSSLSDRSSSSSGKESFYSAVSDKYRIFQSNNEQNTSGYSTANSSFDEENHLSAQQSDIDVEQISSLYRKSSANTPVSNERYHSASSGGENYLSAQQSAIDVEQMSSLYKNDVPTNASYHPDPSSAYHSSLNSRVDQVMRTANNSDLGDSTSYDRFMDTMSDIYGRIEVYKSGDSELSEYNSIMKSLEKIEASILSGHLELSSLSGSSGHLELSSLSGSSGHLELSSHLGSSGHLDLSSHLSSSGHLDLSSLSSSRRSFRQDTTLSSSLRSFSHAPKNDSREQSWRLSEVSDDVEPVDNMGGRDWTYRDRLEKEYYESLKKGTGGEASGERTLSFRETEGEASGERTLSFRETGGEASGERTLSFRESHAPGSTSSFASGKRAEYIAELASQQLAEISRRSSTHSGRQWSESFSPRSIRSGASKVLRTTRSGVSNLWRTAVENSSRKSLQSVSKVPGLRTDVSHPLKEWGEVTRDRPFWDRVRISTIQEETDEALSNDEALQRSKGTPWYKR